MVSLIVQEIFNISHTIHILFSISTLFLLKSTCYRWGIIGVTEQYILGKTENMRYLKEVELIGDHIGRICESAVTDDGLNSMSLSISNASNDFKNQTIESEKEYEILNHTFS